MTDSEEVIKSGANFQIGEGNEKGADVDTGLGIPKDLGLDIDRFGETQGEAKPEEPVTAQTLTIPDDPYKMPKAENSEISTDYGSTNNDSLLGMATKKDSKVESPKNKDKSAGDKEDEEYLRRRSNQKDLEKGNVNEDDENDDSTGVELRIFGRLMSQMKISFMHTILVVYAIFIPFRLLLCACFGLMLSEDDSDKDSDGGNRTKWTVLGVSLDNFFSCMAMMVILFHLSKYKWTSRSLGVSSFGMLWVCLFFMFWVSMAQLFSGPNAKNAFIKLFNVINLIFILAVGGATAYGFYQWRDTNQPAQTEAEKKALLKEKRREEKRKQKEKKAKDEKKEKKEDKDEKKKDSTTISSP